MQSKTKRILFWLMMVIVWLLGVGLNLMIEKHVAMNFVIDRMVKSPLPVQTYLLLCGLLTFIFGEILLYSYQKRNARYPLVFMGLLLIGYFYDGFYYYLLLIVVGGCFELLTFLLTTPQEDTIQQVLNEVSQVAETLEQAEDEMIEIKEEEIIEEPEIVFEEVNFDEVQREEMAQFLDSLFVHEEAQIELEKEVEQPLVQEILEDANDILEEANVKEEPPIIKEAAKEAVTLEKKPVEKRVDELEAALMEEPSDLGEFDEEIPLDDFTQEA